MTPLRRWLRHILAEQWTIGVVDAPIHSFLAGRIPGPVSWLPETTSGFFADPFGIERTDGTLGLLAEAYDAGAGRAAIAALPYDGRAFGAPATALSGTQHLSYPYLLQWEGEIYCVPECWSSGEVSLYRAVTFPGHWEKDAVLIRDFDAVDSTVFRHDGLWWLACTRKKDHGSNEALYLFHASELHGPWRPHARNPVRRGRAGSRPGGTPFEHAGVLYRPAQDCSRTYGGRIIVQEVVALTTERFDERPCCCIDPDPDGPYPHGLHTLSAAGRYTLIDGKRFRYPILSGMYRAWSGLASKNR
jgi:hypothetical protein